MSNDKLAKIPDEVRAQAKDLYMRGADLNEIASKLKISTAALGRWRTQDGWLAERTAGEQGLLEDDWQNRKVQISKILNASVRQITRGIKHLEDRIDPPTLTEVERLSVIVANLDKIARLDSSRSTENVSLQASVSLNIEQIRDIISSDPFFTSVTAVPKETSDA